MPDGTAQGLGGGGRALAQDEEVDAASDRLQKFDGLVVGQSLEWLVVDAQDLVIPLQPSVPRGGLLMKSCDTVRDSHEIM